MSKKTLIEETAKIKVGNFPKEFMIPARIINDLTSISEETLRYKKTGSIKLPGGKPIKYSLDLEPESPLLILDFITGTKENHKIISQSVLLIRRELTFGTGWYFLCSCGRQCETLYLPLHALRFGCRKCHDLTYSSCLEDKNSANGLFYCFNLMNRIMARQERVKRISYGGKFTKRAARFIESRAKMIETVTNLREKVEPVCNSNIFR